MAEAVELYRQAYSLCPSVDDVFRESQSRAQSWYERQVQLFQSSTIARTKVYTHTHTKTKTKTKD
jgi:hypothetical protein